jgi:NtrC-family two-component system sensor histidine kinase KinB
MVGPEKQTLGVAVFLVDVTRLRSADEAKSGLVSTVSHELRTPLTSIRMALSLLTREKLGTLSPKQLSLVSVAREDSDRLHRIIENLLSISRMESGRAQFTFQPMRPREILDQAVAPMRAAFAEKSISIDVAAPENLPSVQADPVAILSAMTNLLSNALKFVPRGGGVHASAAVSDHGVTFSVADTGPGIPAEFVGRVFDKFFRVPREEGPTGAGLGLAIAKEVIEAHGGTIRLASTSPAGCKFQIELPCSPQAARVAAATGVG